MAPSPSPDDSSHVIVMEGRNPPPSLSTTTASVGTIAAPSPRKIEHLQELTRVLPCLILHVRTYVRSTRQLLPSPFSCIQNPQPRCLNVLFEAQQRREVLCVRRPRALIKWVHSLAAIAFSGSHRLHIGRLILQTRQYRSLAISSMRLCSRMSPTPGGLAWNGFEQCLSPPVRTWGAGYDA